MYRVLILLAIFLHPETRLRDRTRSESTATPTIGDGIEHRIKQSAEPEQSLSDNAAFKSLSIRIDLLFSELPKDFTAGKFSDVKSLEPKINEFKRAFGEAKNKMDSLTNQTDENSTLSLRRQVLSLKSELRYQTVLAEWNRFKEAEERSQFLTKSLTYEKLRPVLEGLLLDREFCFSARNCSKFAKANPPSNPNLEFFFQNLETSRDTAEAPEVAKEVRPTAPALKIAPVEAAKPPPPPTAAEDDDDDTE